jgi:hypothetical protein
MHFTGVRNKWIKCTAFDCRRRRDFRVFWEGMKRREANFCRIRLLAIINFKYWQDILVMQGHKCLVRIWGVRNTFSYPKLSQFSSSLNTQPLVVNDWSDVWRQLRKKSGYMTECPEISHSYVAECIYRQWKVKCFKQDTVWFIDMASYVASENTQWGGTHRHATKTTQIVFACGSRLLGGWRPNGRDLLCSLSQTSCRSVTCTDYLKLKEALYYSANFELSSQSNYCTGVPMTEERQIQAKNLFLTRHKSTKHFWRSTAKSICQIF